jgi:hypothetical protein
MGSADGNREAAEREVQRLLDSAPLPAGATCTSVRPTALQAPTVGLPLDASVLDRFGFWRINEPMAEVWSYLRSHPPAAMAVTATSSSGGPDGMTSEGIAWSEPDHRYATGLQLDVSLAPDAGGRGTIIRADGVGEWLDPRPVREAVAGPRMRLTVAGSCPGSDRSTVGVDNRGPDLSQRLLPTAQPTAALICEYGGMTTSPSFELGRSVRLGERGARQLAHRVAQLPLTHIDGGVYTCPADDGRVDAVAFGYPGRPDVDLWINVTGCRSLSNGTIRVVGGVDLSRWIAPLTARAWPSPIAASPRPG